ncbi:MAG: protein kinase [Planctomycetes bacterium]|nr:protein kinase [Planctomycetota bacterium]
MSQNWYTETDGRVEGPLTSRELRDRAAAGKLRPNDKVSPDGQKWAPASKIKGLTFSDTVSQQPVVTVAATVAMPPASGAAPTAPTQQNNQSQSGLETTETKVDQIPGYEITGVLGKGACGVVYRARQIKLDRVVALKMVLSDRKPTAAALARFGKEAVSLAKLRHPNIVGVHDCGHHDGQAFFAMELLEGEDLGNRLDNGGPMDEFTAWHIARQTAAALAHAADLGVYHRDIKPANLFLTPPPTGYPLPPGVPLVKVTDFGLALTRQASDESTDQRLTAAGVVLGTPAYMPPEQFKGSDIDHRADLYALGATMFHMLSGDSPFNGASIWDVMVKKTEPTPRLGGKVSEESADLIETLMAANPADRIQTYRDFLDRIDSLPFMQGTTASSPSVRITPISKSKLQPVTPKSRTNPPALQATHIGEVEDGFDGERSSGEWQKPQPKNKTKLFIFAGLGGLALAAAVAIGLKFTGEKQPEPIAKPATPQVEYVPRNTVALFDGKDATVWRPTRGEQWTIDKNENGPFLTGVGTVSREFFDWSDYRVVLGLDLNGAKRAEVVIATAEGPTDTALQWSIRIDAEKGTSLGTREGPRGIFKPFDVVIPTPTKEDNADKAGYGEVRYERAGGKIRAFFLGTPLGSIDTAGTLNKHVVMISAEGGNIRIDTAEVQELIEKK